jgi:DNA-binding SARP family transcriptional activator
VEFRILGPLEVLDAHGQRLVVGGPKQRALLAVLLLYAGEVVPVGQLIDELWGEEPPTSCRSMWPTCARCWSPAGRGGGR